ncbi:calcium-binding protein [Dongia rigui]|uniref:Calcium-binding protein n=1 Tax=Dongia rigui TaxID=940149 RepID=A0ABU5E4J0_9PROT|nr:calcium-binding protein [Dongia rigui]MDY0874347.1 calcium-binding protein [Dongia rigui]
MMPQYQNGTPRADILVGTWWNDIIYGDGGHDVIYGDRGNDILSGDTGNDILWGGVGADQLFGDNGFDHGFDIAVYKTSAEAVTVNLSQITQSGAGGEAEGDQLFGIEGLVGSAHHDRLFGNAQNNTFRGGAGGDYIDGSDGIDKASYAYSSAAVHVDLTRGGIQFGGDAQGDILRNIENLQGSDFDDRLIGNDARNTIAGGKGADYIDGGGGYDFVDYRGSSAVNIDLNRATQIGAHAQGDQLVNIENIRGTSFNDVLVGTTGHNELLGDEGNDVIDGGGGNDILKGMNGDDVVTTRSQGFADGGNGVDTLIVHFDERDPYDGVEVYINSNNYLSSRYMSDYDPPAGYNLSAMNFERVELTGTQWSDFLMGTSGNDVLRGGAGDDYIRGEMGDYLDGGGGRDAVEIHYDPTNIMTVNVDFQAGFATGMAGLVGFEDLTVYTGWGNDTIIGGTEFNYVNTQAGGDFVQLFGHHNYADLNPGDFDDFDTYIGSDGVDQVWVGKRGDVDGGGGSEDVLGMRFYGPDAVTMDVLTGTSSSGLTFRNFEQFNLYREDSTAGDNIRLGLSHDFYSGAAGDDFVDGRAGNDILRGGAGQDSLSGGDGSDQLYGDLGHDDLTGGGGDDRFYFSQGHDYITDFNAAEGDLLIIPTDMQDEAHDSFAELMASAEETAAGLRLYSSDTGSTLLLGGITKATFSENSVEFLI